jgi:hypothetical protein
LSGNPDIENQLNSLLGDYKGTTILLGNEEPAHLIIMVPTLLMPLG